VVHNLEPSGVINDILDSNIASLPTIHKTQWCSDSTQAYSGFHYIAKKFNLQDKIFDKNSTSFSSTFRSSCQKTLNTTVSETICFYGIFMGHMMEKGFGFTNSSTHTWDVRFKTKVRFPLSSEDLLIRGAAGGL